jgi:PAS domain S-box-containing protein
MSSHDKKADRDQPSELPESTCVDYHKLFEMMDDGVAVCELVRSELGRPTDYLVLEVNHSFENHTGLSPSQVVGRKRSEFIAIPNVRFLEVAAQIIDSDRPDRLEHYNERLDQWFSIGVFPLGGDRFVQLFHDITERKRAE